MPDDKDPIPKFAAKIKAKYPEYQDMNDTLLVQKIVQKYPEYADKVDMSGIETVKKKEESPLSVFNKLKPTFPAIPSAPQLPSGGPSKKETELPEPQKQKVLGFMQGMKTPEEKFLATDYQGLAYSKGRQKLSELASVPEGAEDPLGTARKKATEAKDINESLDYYLAGRYLKDFTSGYAAKQILETTPFGKKSDENLTAKTLREKAVSYDKSVEGIKNRLDTIEGYSNQKYIDKDLSDASPEYLDFAYTPDLKDAAVVYFANKNPQFKKELQATGLDINEKGVSAKIDSGKMGQIFNEFINDDDINSFVSEEHPNLLPAFKRAQSRMLQDNPKFGINVVANEVSRARQDAGLNTGGFYGEDAKGATDAVANHIYQDDPEKLAIYNKYIKNNQEDYIDAPSFLQRFAEKGGEFFKGIVNTFKEPFTPVSETIKERWEKEASNVSADPKGLAKIMADAGGATGLVASMAATGNVIGGFGLTPTTANATATATGFLGDQLAEGKRKYPDNLAKAVGSATFNTALYTALSFELFPGEKAMAAFKSVEPEMAKVVENLANGTITKEAARQESITLFKKAVDLTGTTLKKNTKIAAEMTGIDMLNKGLDKIMGADPQFSQGDSADVFSSMWLSNLLVAGLAAKGEQKTRNEVAEASIYKAASNPKLTERVLEDLKVKDPNVNLDEMKDNLSFLTKLKESLDASEMPEDKQKRFLTAALQAKVKKEQLASMPESALTRRGQTEVSRYEQIQEDILNEPEVKPFEEPFAESKVAITEPRQTGEEVTKGGVSVIMPSGEPLKKVNEPTEEPVKATEPIPAEEKGQPTQEPAKVEPAAEAGKPPAEPPKSEPIQGETVEPTGNKALATRLVGAENVPEAAKQGIRDKGLSYEPQSQKEAQDYAKGIIDEMGMGDAVLQAQAQRFGGDVNTLVQTETLNRLAEMSDKETDPVKRLELDKKFAEVGTQLDEWLRKQGRGISAINYFYKKSPLGIQIMENVKRKQEFEKWAKPKEQSWKEAFDEMMKEPEFEELVKEKVREGMKQERAEARKARIKKVDDFIDKAKDQFKGGAAYSTIIPPQVITAALEGIKQAYHAGEHVVKIVQDAIDYISKELGHDNWDKEKFRKEWDERLKDTGGRKQLTDEELKSKLLDRFRNKLKGLSDKQKEDVVRKSFSKIVESGGLDYADFRKIIADVTGRGEMTDAEAARLKELVKQTNAVDDAGKRAREERTQSAREDYRKAEVKAGAAARELNQLLYNKPSITKRLTSLMQLNTLGIPALVNNPIYNVFNHLGIRLPVGAVKTGIERLIQGGAKLFGKEYLPEYDIASRKVQKEFFKKLGLGTREAIGKFVTGLDRADYLAKEIQGNEIRPATAIKDLWAYHKGEINLTRKQIIDKVIQASPPGITAEIIARTLNLGDKPQRFAAEGAQAASFAKSFGLKDIDYDLFIDFPREEAYRVYKQKGLSDKEAGEKADYIKDTIVKEGERSTFQQDNMLNDMLNRVFGGKQSGIGGLIKATVVSPYIKIPSNAYWSYYNIVNPEVAMLQAMIYGGKAFAKAKGAKFAFDKPNSSAAKDLHEAKYWLAHATVGMATRAVIIAMVNAGIYRSGNTGDDTKKEREGEQFYENQGTMNLSKLFAWLRGEDPNKVKNGLIIFDRWAGHFGTVGNTIARKNEEMTPDQKNNQSDFWDAAIGNMELYALQDFEQGVFGNTQSLLSSLQQGIKTGNINNGLNAWGVNTLNMFANIVHPAASAQVEKAFLPYYTKQKADSFMQEVKNSMLTRSAILRNVTNQYPPSKIGIWGDRLDKKDNVAMRLFGISKANDDNFAQPIYEDYKKTNDIGFFPPAIPPEVNGKKTNTEQTAKLEEYVGHARKNYIAPFINDQATIDGFEVKYSELDKNEKKYVLQYLYQLGKEDGVKEFEQQYPEFKKEEKEVDYSEEVKKELFRILSKYRNGVAPSPSPEPVRQTKTRSQRIEERKKRKSLQ